MAKGLEPSGYIHSSPRGELRGVSKYIARSSLGLVASHIQICVWAWWPWAGSGVQPKEELSATGDCGSDTDSRDSPFKTITQNMHMLCTRNSGELVLGELQGVIIKIHLMQLRVINLEVL